jgi:tetratricopeptide (TPR) repeat protein
MVNGKLKEWIYISFGLKDILLRIFQQNFCRNKMNKICIKTSIFFLVVFFIQPSSFAFITVLGKGDASLCYQSAKTGTGGITAVNTCLSAINDMSLTQKDLYATYVNLGIIYNNAKKPDNAIEYLNKGLEYNGTLPESLLSLGNSFYLKKNYEKAIQLYDQSLDKGLNDISAVYFNKGLVYERMSNVDLAIKFYKKAVELKPQYYDYFEKRARLQRSGEWTN